MEDIRKNSQSKYLIQKQKKAKVIRRRSAGQTYLFGKIYNYSWYATHTHNDFLLLVPDCPGLVEQVD